MNEMTNDSKEPMVKISSYQSNDPLLARIGKVGAVPLSRVDDLFRDISDHVAQLPYVAGDNSFFERTDFRIDYTMGGERRFFDSWDFSESAKPADEDGEFDEDAWKEASSGYYPGLYGNKSLVDHIEAEALARIDVYSKSTDPDSIEKKRKWEKILDEFVPYLREHVRVAKAGRNVKVLQNMCGDIDGVKEYCEKFHEYVETCQTELNREGAGHLPDEPDSKTFGLTESPASMLQRTREAIRTAGFDRAPSGLIPEEYERILNKHGIVVGKDWRGTIYLSERRPFSKYYGGYMYFHRFHKCSVDENRVIEDLERQYRVGHASTEAIKKLAEIPYLERKNRQDEILQECGFAPGSSFIYVRYGGEEYYVGENMEEGLAYLSNHYDSECFRAAAEELRMISKQKNNTNDKNGWLKSWNVNSRSNKPEKPKHKRHGRGM